MNKGPGRSSIPATVEPEELRTSDIGLAAFLLSRGFELARVEPLPDGRRVFGFRHAARADATAFYQNALVPGRAFANALRDLKAMIRET